MSSQHKRQKPQESHPKFGHLPLSTSGPQDCALTGSALLNTPYFNKGSAFPAGERKEFNLTGLIPQHVATLEEQVKRAYQQYSSRGDDLAKNTFMTSMKEQNEVLFYRVCFTLHLLRQICSLLDWGSTYGYICNDFITH
jgi:malate dehydrogenase (oxaloacetate-decarboxylating)